MSVEIEISTEALRSYARTDDALEAFNMTVANGQTRLSLQVLVDIINALVDKVEELEEKIDKHIPVESSIEDIVVDKQEIKIEEVKPETKVIKEKIEDKSKV